MDFIELARRRCSIRGYKPDPVPEELLEKVLEAGRLAPSAKNLQPYHFIVVRSEAGRAALAEAYPAPFFREAPVVLAICTESSKAWTRERYDRKNACDIDAAIAVDHMTLAAEELGLGTCWIIAFDPEKVSRALGLPDGVEPFILLPLGFPNAPGREKTRKSLDQLVRHERW